MPTIPEKPELSGEEGGSPDHAGPPTTTAPKLTLGSVTIEQRVKPDPQPEPRASYRQDTSSQPQPPRMQQFPQFPRQLPPNTPAGGAAVPQIRRGQNFQSSVGAEGFRPNLSSGGFNPQGGGAIRFPPPGQGLYTPQGREDTHRAQGDGLTRGQQPPPPANIMRGHQVEPAVNEPRMSMPQAFSNPGGSPIFGPGDLGPFGRVFGLGPLGQQGPGQNKTPEHKARNMGGQEGEGNAPQYPNFNQRAGVPQTGRPEDVPRQGMTGPDSLQQKQQQQQQQQQMALLKQLAGVGPTLPPGVDLAQFLAFLQQYAASVPPWNQQRGEQQEFLNRNPLNGAPQRADLPHQDSFGAVGSSVPHQMRPSQPGGPPQGRQQPPRSGFPNNQPGPLPTYGAGLFPSMQQPGMEGRGQTEDRSRGGGGGSFQYAGLKQPGVSVRHCASYTGLMPLAFAQVYIHVYYLCP